MYSELPFVKDMIHGLGMKC